MGVVTDMTMIVMSGMYTLYSEQSAARTRVVHWYRLCTGFGADCIPDDETIF